VRRHPLLPPLLGTGLLGGFTTLSTWSEETRSLVAHGHTAAAGGYVVATLAACLAAVALADQVSTRASRAEFDDEEGDW
jgi:CrcB protein